MSSIRVHKPNGALFFDFRVNGQRCREYTLLQDTPANRKKMEAVLKKIEADIHGGAFVYEKYFPNSKALKRALARAPDPHAASRQDKVREFAEPQTAPADAPPPTALFGAFAGQWVDERSIEWRRSHTKSLLSTLNGRILPYFGKKVVGEITKSDILAFRANLAKEPGRGEKAGLSSKRINEIVGVLGQIMDEAADRFQFTTPTNGIRRLKQRKVDVQPFTLAQVHAILDTVRKDYRDYFTVRFLTGMRTGEVHGLKWKYVDFERRQILVRETFVLGEDEYTKTDGSQREIQMSQPVLEALLRQHEATGKLSEYVFCNRTAQPLDNKNFTDRVWYPLLRHLGYEERRPYQMRHTAATLWLAAGEAPEWIARQLGHTTTEMLFRVYSRFVPNLTRQDGSAIERLLASRFSRGQLVPVAAPGPTAGQVYEAEVLPAPLQIPKPRGLRSKSPKPQVAPRPQRPQGDDDPQPPPAWALQRVTLAAAHVQH
jgi:integrase